MTSLLWDNALVFRFFKGVCMCVDWCWAAPGGRLWADLSGLGFLLETLESHCPPEDTTLKYSCTAHWLTLNIYTLPFPHLHTYKLQTTNSQRSVSHLTTTTFTVYTTRILNLQVVYQCLSLSYLRLCYTLTQVFLHTVVQWYKHKFAAKFLCLWIMSLKRCNLKNRNLHKFHASYCAKHSRIASYCHCIVNWKQKWMSWRGNSLTIRPWA